MKNERLWAMQHRFAPYLFVAPFVVLFCIFMLYPLGRSLMLSLYSTAGPRTRRFVGLSNYIYFLRDPLFWFCTLNTIAYAVVFLLVQIPTSLGLALLLNSKRVQGRNLFRFAFFSPLLVGHVFVAIIFMLLLAERHGLLDQMLGLFWKRGAEINWIGDGVNGHFAVIIAWLWLSVGYGMVYLLAALQSVDRQLYEAAEVDGASAWAQFWNVTLPGIRPVLMFLMLVGTIGAFQLFELPYVLFQGAGPAGAGLTIVMFLFQNGFEMGDIGGASAIGWLLVLIILAVSLLQMKITKVAKDVD